MHSKDLEPPRTGLAANPVLYGVANGLARLFPPVEQPCPSARPGAEAERRRSLPQRPTTQPAE